jgi:hypothetical protein
VEQIRLPFCDAVREEEGGMREGLSSHWMLYKHVLHQNYTMEESMTIPNQNCATDIFSTRNTRPGTETGKEAGGGGGSERVDGAAGVQVDCGLRASKRDLVTLYR